MTREEALKVLVKMRAWREWGKEQIEEERPEMPEQKEVDEAFDVCIKLLQSFLSSNLDEAAEISDLEAKNLADDYTKFLAAGLTKNEPRPIGSRWMKKLASDRFKAGAEWMAGQGETRDDIVVTGDFGGKAHIFPIPSSEFNPGDRVVVQIRKK